MKNLFVIATVSVAFIIASPVVQAASFTFSTNLNGASQVPPNASPATGFGSLVLDDVAMTITVNESWSGLLAPATASHIHMPALPGANAGVVFGFVGVPNVSSGAILQQVFAVTPARITQFWQGLAYMNIHTSTFPGGEIRGQLVTPEPSSLLILAGLVVPAVSGIIRRNRSLR
ncbi:MAG: CHRD domain-containing protein [Armatimonadota bacterium]